MALKKEKEEKEKYGNLLRMKKLETLLCQAPLQGEKEERRRMIDLFLKEKKKLIYYATSA